MGDLPEERRRHPDRPGLRLFVAAYPPPEVADALARAAQALDLPPHRPTPPDQVHLTLLFLGEVDPRRLDSVIESAERAAAGIGAFELAPDRLISLPERGPARLVAAAAPEAPPLTELTRRLAHRLAAHRRKERSRAGERFLPHLTLLRFRSAVAKLVVDEAIPVERFVVDRISVMRSTLLRGGAEHREVKEIGL